MAKIFSLLSVVKRDGNGLYRISETWEKKGFVPPLIEESLNPPTVQLTLSMRTDPKTSVISDEEKIIGLITADGSISIDKIAQMIGLSKTITTAHINRLKEKGKLERTGEKRGGRWIIKT